MHDVGWEEELLSEDEVSELYDLAWKYEKGSGVKKDLVKAAELFVKADINGCQKTRVLYHFSYDDFTKKVLLTPDEIEILRISAENGYADAQFSLGARYRSGLGGLPKDNEKAVFWLKKAAERNHIIAISHLADMYYKGRVVGKDLKKASEYYKKAADLGYAPAQMSLGVMYENGEYVEKDVENALQYLEMSGEGGYPIAYNRIAKMYEEGTNVGKDLKKAFEYYSKSAEMGYPGGHYGLFRFYYGGLYVERDTARAMYHEKFVPPIINTLSDAIMDVGLRQALADFDEYGKDDGRMNYLKGVACVKYGENDDIDDAVLYLKRAAELGNRNAYYSLGQLYETRIRESNSDSLALYYYMMAAKMNDKKAFFKLGKFFEEGIGTEPDLEVAFKYYYKAAKGGDVGSAVFMYRCYRCGILVERDDSQAERWLVRIPISQREKLKNMIDKEMKNQGH